MRISQVDAFADQPFTGNPAAVCLFSGAPDDAWKQDVAREMNLAATAFVPRDPPDEGGAAGSDAEHTRRF
jgi:predicted PhzF superfamily epimerase YddE/YHI9